MLEDRQEMEMIWDILHQRVTAKPGSVVHFGRAVQGDGKLISLWCETQDVVTLRLKLQHHSSITYQLETCVPPRQCNFFSINRCLRNPPHPKLLRSSLQGP